nr:hypothetical protein [Endozoicomonas sp.]
MQLPQTRAIRGFSSYGQLRMHSHAERGNEVKRVDIWSIARTPEYDQQR